MDQERCGQGIKQIKGGSKMKRLAVILVIAMCFSISLCYAGQVEIVCVLDKSGSMQPVQEDIVGSFNTFLASQKKALEGAMFTLVLFDSDIKTTRGCIDDFDRLTPDQYQPEGSTALYDALGETITDIENQVTPETIVIFAIITDGEENSSNEYSSKEIKYLIQHFQKWHPWSFLFLAANQDAFTESQKIGIQDGYWSNISLTNEVDCSAAFDSVTDAVLTITNGDTVDLTDDQISVNLDEYQTDITP